MNISVRWMSLLLAGVAVLLVGLHLLFYWLVMQFGSNGLINLALVFDVDQEASIPTWFAQILLFIAAAIAVFVAIAEPQHKLRKYWYVVAALFLVMSIDEGSSIHETVGVWVGQGLGWEIALGSVVIRDWVLLAGLIVIAVGLLLWRFIKALPVRTVLLLGAAAFIFISGALITETLHFTALNIEFGSPAQRISNAIEEGLEMLGAVVFIYTLADYAARHTKPQKIKIS